MPERDRGGGEVTALQCLRGTRGEGGDMMLAVVVGKGDREL